MSTERQMEREISIVEREHDEGLISTKEMNERIRDIEREAAEFIRERHESSYRDEMGW